MLALALAALLVEPLAARHRLWLEDEVSFLIGSGERARFEALSTSEERDRFIEAFWRLRDPTPGTLANEAREEYEARRAASDRLFGPPDRGRLSERGRLYQLLGPPAFRESFASAREGLVPLELWHYTGVTVSFLPEAFYLIFFRRGGVGPFELWSPGADGAEALLRDAAPGRFRLEEGLPELSRIDPELAAAVRDGLVAGPPARSAALLAAVRGFADLAERERALRGATETAVDFERLEASLELAVLLDDAGLAELHYALDLVPGQSERLSWRRSGGELRSRVALSGRLLGDGGAELERWEDELELAVAAETLDALRPLRFSFRGRRFVPRGARGIELSLASPGGAFLVEARPLPDAGLAVVPRAAELEGPSPDALPFRLGTRILMPGPVPEGSDALAAFQPPPESGVVTWQLFAGDGDAPLWSASEAAENGELVERRLPTAALAAGTYRLRAGWGMRIAEAPFRVGDALRGEERVLAREPTPVELARYLEARAEAFRRAGRRGRAIEEMERVVGLTGAISDELELATLRFADGRCEDVRRQLQPLAADTREPDVLVLLAACAESLGDLQLAERSYARALELAPEDEGIRAVLDRLRRRKN